MLNRICSYLFLVKRRFFEDLFLEDMIGYIPNGIANNATEFLSNNSEKLQKWLLWQSHIIQKKIVAEPHNSEVFRGMMLEIKILLMLSAKKEVINRQPVEENKEVKKDPFAGVEEFINYGKTKN